MRKLFAMFTSLLAIFALAACTTEVPSATGAAPNKSRDVAIMTQVYAVPIVKDLVDKMSGSMTERGWKPSVSDTSNDFNKLNSLIQDAAARRVGAIVLVAADPEQIAPGLESAKTAGVPVFFVFGGTEPRDDVMLMIASDDAGSGRNSAQALIDSYRGSGTVLMIGADAVPSNRVRTEAAQAAFKAAGIPTTDVKQITQPSSSQEDGMNLTHDYIQANPGELAGVWSVIDEASVGAAQALERAGTDGVPVVGVGGSEQARAEIAKGGPFTASVITDHRVIVSTLVNAMAANFDGTPPAEPLVLISGEVVDASNVADFS
jgi:ribose transport system substrate-binding protein